MVKKLVFGVLFSVFATYIAAQPGNRGFDRSQMPANGIVRGVVLDSTTKKRIEYATLSIFRLPADSLVGGGITDEKGNFELSGLRPGRYKLKIEFIGYEPSFRAIALRPGAMELDLGAISVQPSSETLNTATVIGSARKVTYDIDKRVVNVGDLNTVMSESAVEILQNVPGVSVDIEGNVSLRGSSNFTLLIDGKPTVLEVADALQQIPASAIHSIEIITNPSAKYEAEGVSGIVNIIMKRSKLQGMSGLVNTSVGTYDNYSTDAVLSYNAKKVTVNLTANYGQGTRPNWERGVRTTFTNENTLRLESEGETDFIRSRYGLSGELVYRMNHRNTLTLNGNLGKHDMKSYAVIDFRQFVNDVRTQTYDNKQDWTRNGFHHSAGATYSHQFPGGRDHKLDISGIINLRDGEEESINRFRDPQLVVQGGNRLTEVGPNNLTRFNIDYVRPLSNGMKIEMGSQVQFGTGSDETVSYQYNIQEGDFLRDSSRSYLVDYLRDIYAGYFMVNGEQGKLGYQFGLRGEYTDRLIAVKGFDDAAIERMDWFPTLHFSYKMKNQTQALLSYSRRIQRPRSWYLEPFTIWNDAFNARRGNPDLLPEYIDAYELSWVKDFKKQGSLSIEAYFRQNHNNIERVLTSLDSNVVVSTPANVGNSYNSGIEVMTNHMLYKIWRVDLSGSFYDYRVRGTYGDLVFDNQSFSYNLRWNNTWVLKKYKVQLEQRYQSRIVTAQGERKGFWTANFSIRQQYLKNKLAATLQVNDIFSTTRNVNSVVGDFFNSNNHEEPRTPTVALSLSLKLNNYNQRQQRNGGGGDDEF
ncbi:MAG: TonB-dependent receptor [Flavobacteriales bacterium]|nr:TonB-dependent receptor [Flavobacteriales bacterium]